MTIQELSALIGKRASWGGGYSGRRFGGVVVAAFADVLEVYLDGTTERKADGYVLIDADEYPYQRLLPTSMVHLDDESAGENDGDDEDDDY